MGTRGRVGFLEELATMRDGYVTRVRRWRGAAGDEEDVVHDAFVRAAAGASALRDVAHREEWFFRVLRTAYLDHRRRGDARTRMLGEVAVEAALAGPIAPRARSARPRDPRMLPGVSDPPGRMWLRGVIVPGALRQLRADPSAGGPMILMKSALSSILVVLGACDRASVDASPAPAATAPVAAAPVVTAPAPVAKTSAGRVKTAPKTVYVCPMHPEVVSDVPGLCPKCNMKLDPKPQVTEVREQRPEAPAAP